MEDESNDVDDESSSDNDESNEADIEDIAEIMEDVQQNDNSKYWLAVEIIVSKLYAHLELEREIQMKVDKFWVEFTLFKEKKSPFDRPHLWNSEDIQNSNSQLWNQK
eukprot:14998342-Ditylum_brightwellii.AAC.1